MKIAFVAMSGTRAFDRELMEFGLTLPGFVERSKVIASLPSLGLLTLAGLTPSHHERAYLEVPDVDAFLATDDGLDTLTGFDLAAISSYSAQIMDAYRLADALRRRGVIVVMGGLHVTALPHEAAAHCDAVVIGEGELCWTEVICDLEAGRVRPLYDVSASEFDLALAPLPAFDLLEIERYNRLTVQTSRGCPHRCEFCASSILLTKHYKQKPAAKVLAEIDRICELWDKPFIEFADDNSFVNHTYWKSLLPQLAFRRVRWFTETDIAVARDEELLELMRESGCAQVLIGLESPTRGALNKMELHGNWKYAQWPRYRESIRRIQSHGISVNGCFVVGLDEHDSSVFDEILRYVEELELAEVQVTIQTPFPGTPLYERLLRDRRILQPGAWWTCTLFDINYQPAHMSVAELRTGFKELIGELYSDERTRRRRARFRSYLRTGRRLKPKLTTSGVAGGEGVS
ncbi:MAG TPA: radical SAM protein [candidate division Zixibacteria bacterium]|nr:radical SAM protein [candidate division Zixibacteria bacterium]